MSALAAVGAGLLLADDTDTGDELHKAGPIAIVVIIALCIACFFLFRSMSKHMRRVREGFPGVDGAPPGAMGSGGGSGGGGGPGPAGAGPHALGPHAAGADVAGPDVADPELPRVGSPKSRQ